MPARAMPATARSPCRHGMAGGFISTRRDNDWLDASPAPIRPQAGLTAGKRNWDVPFSWGLFEIGGDQYGPVAEVLAARRRAA